jgi:hypothetical protein
LTINLPKPSFAGAAGGGWRREVVVPMSGPDTPHRDCSDLPLPRWGVFSGKSPRTCRRWRLFFVRFVPGRMLRPARAATTDNIGRFPLPNHAGPVSCTATPAIKNHAEVDRYFFFHQVPSLHAVLLQSRSEPVNALRSALMASTRLSISFQNGMKWTASHPQGLVQHSPMDFALGKLPV